MSVGDIGVVAELDPSHKKSKKNKKSKRITSTIDMLTGGAESSVSNRLRSGTRIGESLRVSNLGCHGNEGEENTKGIY